ncbi:Anaphase-promoting complex subunit cut9 [Neolecta irregularis DAH-3]|uniref:Anaphase-promoting complex subunit cut9 n=1 Tax=Neolecta irregularis (strain DAH-3) TaxID=1198029 RepID=A0A1U7LJS7_NEOID|nr:Anaphase-promoting complex subunit cut9 [Neolecta irregularis DAH-3]|eukprot:OLL22910.1 Anaphase-promoting complex subunit cut9 [Neolecta irregularis DAH-3]
MTRKPHRDSSLATPSGFGPHDGPSTGLRFAPQGLSNLQSSTLAISPITSHSSRTHRRPDSSFGGLSHIDVHSTTDEIQSTHIDRLRMWRHDATMQHQYESASFVGENILDMTGDPNDTFWLAQIYYARTHYSRAHELLQKNDLLETSAACRYLAALCLVKQSKWRETLDLLGEQNPFGRGRGLNKIRNQDGGIQLEASMCYLRGLVFLNQNNFDRAKASFKEALLIDVKCYDAFQLLVNNSLLTAEEEQEFLTSLDFGELPEEDGDFIKLLYSTKLNKYKSAELFQSSSQKLKEKYKLEKNTDLMQSQADLLFVQCKFQACYKITQKILEIDQYKFHALPLHLACMHSLRETNKLFLLSHDLADKYPHEPATWLAVGTYYLSISKVAEARRYFSKASMMDPHFGPAWIGFAHSFALEGEHDQAISAYSTAARLFQGFVLTNHADALTTRRTHLPPLFLGMQHLALNNMALAEEYLNTSMGLCNSDPLLLNELGVVQYQKQDYQKAIYYFRAALRVALATEQSISFGKQRPNYWLYKEALAEFEEVLRVNQNDHETFAAIGLVFLHLGKIQDAILNLHEAASFNPGDPVIIDLLQRALDRNAEGGFIDSIPEPPEVMDGSSIIAEDMDEFEERSGRSIECFDASGNGLSVVEEETMALSME